MNSGTVLKWFLGQRHWQSYQSFRREWDKAAATVDASLTAPGERTLRRWKSGGIHVPHAERCRVLESMFPGYTADQLFAPLPKRKPRARRCECRGQMTLFEVMA
ncbi:hypothetical protein [Nocardia terpenica]|uniref:Uncharacterized protein n=1 Tax=Nocardia terpenica TaxID=455432 RepID=A0A164NYZ0_9NOCA|nr:hypothetical protein [Nocardia terpenica]KZM73824.1 hypothetical protein AWN90_35355 [Nocardia terpenica]KZM74901.1 hypothetical protein AWN90_23065 [Nocardia terpenica]NQE86905.1 hypothetical protein [Nocardia terpenica]NQE93441.1 hypothetical protein [Nocardia terpenica]